MLTLGPQLGGLASVSETEGFLLAVGSLLLAGAKRHG